MQKQKATYHKNSIPKLGSAEKNLLKELLYALDRNLYLKDIGFNLFDWQADVINATSHRKVILASRQAGKSTVVSAIPCHTAKYYPKSVSLILAPTETQAGLNMSKVKDFISLDPNYPKIKRNSDSLVELENGSKIYVVPATDKAARGYSKPRCIVLDEASRILDVVYTSGIRPMLTDNPDCELIALSTPFGKTGFFYQSLQKPYWDKYFVRSPFEITEDRNGNQDVHRVDAEELKVIQAQFEARGIKFYISDRHYSYEEQVENLYEMGKLQYQQEYMCEFVDPVDNVFSYEDIEALRNSVGEELALPDFDLYDDGLDMQNIINATFGA